MPDKTKVHTVYKTQDGKRVPSVTTILGILGKPALIHWAWQQGIEGKDYREVRDQAGDIGTLAHYLVMCHLLGEGPDISEYSAHDIEKAENCLLSYYEWAKNKEIVPELVEEPLISEGYRFGGTVDFYGKIDGVYTLLDFKTGKGIYDDYFYQVAAYYNLLHENGYLVQAVKILRIGRDEDEGFEERTIGNLDNYWKIFCACREIYELQKRK